MLQKDATCANFLAFFYAWSDKIVIDLNYYLQIFKFSNLGTLKLSKQTSVFYLKKERFVQLLPLFPPLHMRKFFNPAFYASWT